MCKNQRATFSKVLIEDDGKVETYYTTSIKRKTTWLTATGVIIAAIVGLLTIRGAVITGIRGVAGDEFKKELGVFHTVAKPEIERSMDTKIELHRRSGVHPGGVAEAELNSTIGEIKGDIKAVQTTVTQIQGENTHQTELIEELLRKVD
jgi:hypothetical protein